MSQPEYRWRRLTPKQRAELLAWRKGRGQPWHSPPHRPNFGHLRFHITAACFEHQPCIGHRPGRMDDFARDLLAVFACSGGHPGCRRGRASSRPEKRFAFSRTLETTSQLGSARGHSAGLEAAALRQAKMPAATQTGSCAAVADRLKPGQPDEQLNERSHVQSHRC